jgi:hypothetical protein
MMPGNGEKADVSSCSGDGVAVAILTGIDKPIQHSMALISPNGISWAQTMVTDKDMASLCWNGFWTRCRRQRRDREA